MIGILVAAFLVSPSSTAAWEDLLFMDLEDVVSTWGRIVSVLAYTPASTIPHF